MGKRKLLTAVGSSVSVTTLDSFDEFGRVTASTQKTAGVLYPAMQYEYYADGSLAWMTYPSARAVTTCYDSAGRPQWVSSDSQFPADACRQQTGAPLASKAYATGVTYAAHGAASQLNLGTRRLEQLLAIRTATRRQGALPPT